MFLLIDNYDSFTYNLYHFLSELGATLEVIRNDQIAINEALVKGTSGLILSPGPCTPNEAGICLDIAKAALQNPFPLLGVCLGHQAIGQAAGSQVVRAPKVMHGKISKIEHKGKGMFHGLEEPIEVARYHSLILDKTPDGFNETAHCEGQVMGISHKTLPIHGLQFHPESIATPKGKNLLKNFLDIADTWTP